MRRRTGERWTMIGKISYEEDDESAEATIATQMHRSVALARQSREEDGGVAGVGLVRGGYSKL